jgi:hypothetical protein
VAILTQCYFLRILQEGVFQPLHLISSIEIKLHAYDSGSEHMSSLKNLRWVLLRLQRCGNAISHLVISPVSRITAWGRLPPKAPSY